MKTHPFICFLNSFANSIRRENKLFHLALVCFLLPLVLSFIVAYINPEIIHLIENDAQLIQLEKSFDPSSFNLRQNPTFVEYITMLNFYIVSNTIVAFLVLFSGLFLGFGTIIVLAYQGISMGLKVGYLTQLGYGETLWPFLIGHTSFELIATIIAGWCGFKIGLSIINPGSLPRLKALLNSIQDVSYIMIMVLFLFLCAALIETFWSPNTGIHSFIKYSFGAFTWIALIYYFLIAGKSSGDIDSKC